MFENRALRKIRVPKRDKVTGERRLHNEKLMICTRQQIRKNEMGRTCSMYGRQERCIQGFVGET
jgi:hypothetical protein